MPDKGAGGENVDSEILKREFIYLWYYFTVQLQQIFRYWVLGMMIGSAVSVFAKEPIHRALGALQKTRLGIFGIIAASALGIASPLCMYGTIPIAASFSKGGMKDDWPAATIGVPLYACGGGTIPLLQQWLFDGMSVGSAASFMLTGPATKITNLGALKIVLGAKHFLMYLAFTMVFSFATGLLVNLIL